MTRRNQKGIVGWVKGVFSSRAEATTEIDRARCLIDAIDRGGVPLNPARVNAIARDLGLEVSTRAPVEQTIERIRQALARVA